MFLTSYLLYWVNTGFDFDKMQIPCNGQDSFSDQNQRMKGESSHLRKLQMDSRVIQIAKSDSVINSVYCLNILKT